MIRFTCGRNKGAQIREPAEGIQAESGPGSQGNTCSAIGLLRSDPHPYSPRLFLPLDIE